MTDTTPIQDTPTVVLVHGAFVDGSSWAGVITELEAAGVDVIAPPNMLRGIDADAAYLTGLVNGHGGPVVLVGHSYGGAVITQAGTDADRVVGLVYVAAFAPEENEPLGEINARYPDVPLAGALRTFNYTNERGDEITEALIDRASFRNAVCADLPEEVADLLARTQRSASLSCFTSVVSGTPAWKSVPSWAVVATADRAIDPAAVRDMAVRAGAEITEIDASHAVGGSQPSAVADVILRAVKSTS